MATQKTTVVVDVVDNGSTEKLNQQAQKTHKSFKDLAKTAASIVTGKGTQGSNMVAASAAPKGSQAVMSDQAYGAARGTAGVTGASARDFARQAEGLGGLVRLYATYAANVYALGAAFRALSAAMDTSNMVRGLDQLGASTGVALGTLSKRFAEATDGAISLREAMEATVKASSSGMDSDQILRMAKVAKQASQALGVDMSDAISRISRGITKLEPELLDELGLFTKTGKAAEDYARSVGKSVSQLTDFERRAAFANAVLAEGEAKFGSIQLDTNPYTKLLASVRDLSQTFLEFVNKALAPAIELLSNSPTLLGTAIAGLGAILIKQAIPAIGEVREGFAKAAEVSASAAKRRFADLDKINKLETAARLKELDDRAQAEAEKFHAASDKLVAAYNDRNKKMADLGVKARQIAEKAASEVTDKELAWLKKRSEAVTSKGMPTGPSSLYKQQYDALVKFREEEEKYQQAAKQLLKEREEAQNSLTTAANTYRVYQRELSAAQSKEIASNAAYIGSIKGMSAAWQQLNADIAAARKGPTTRTFDLEEIDAAGNKVTRTITETIPQMDRLRAGMTRVAGTIGLVTGALGTLINAFSPWLAAIGLAVGLLSILDSVASKASKGLDQFNSSTADLNKSAETLAATLDKLNNNNPFSVSSLEAQASAMRNFAESIDSVVKAAQKAQVDIAASTYDSIKDAIFSLFGGGLQKNFSSALSEEISSAADSLKSSPVATKFNKSVEAILGIKDASNFEQLTKAISKLDPKSEKVRELQKAIKDAGTDASIAASKAREFDNAFLNAQKSYANIIEKFKVKDELTLFAIDSATALGKLSTSLRGDITTSLDNIKTLIEGINKAPIFGVDQTEGILALQTRLNDTASALSQNQKSVAALRKEYSDLNKVAKERLKNLDTNNSFDAASASDATIRNQQNYGQYKSEAEKFIKARQELEASISSAQAQGVKLRVAGSKLAADLSKFVDKGLQNSIGLVATSIQAALAKAGNKELESIYAQIDFVPELAGKEYDIKLKQLDAEAALVKVNRELVQATLLSAARTRELSAITAKQMLDKASEETRTAPGSASLRKFENLQEQFPSADKELAAARQAIQLLGEASTNPNKALNTLKSNVSNMSDEAKALVPEILAATQALAGFDVQLANIADQQALIRLVEKPIGESKKRSAEDIRKETNIGKDIAEDQRALASKMQLSGVTKALIVEENRLAVSKLDSDEKIKQLELQEKYNQRVILANGLKALGQTKDAEATLEAAKRLKEEDEGLLKKWKSNELSAISLSTGQKLYNLEVERQNIANRLADAQLKGVRAEEDAALQVRELQLQTAKETGQFSEEYLNSLNYQLEVFKINEEAKRQESDLTREYNRNKDALEAELLLKGGKDTSAGATVFAQIEAETEAYNKQRAAIGLVAQSKLQAAEASKTFSDSQLELNKSLEWLKGLDSVLVGIGSAFEGLGTKIADTVSAFDALNKQQTANANSLADIEKRKKEIEESGDSVGIPLLKEEAALRKKIQKDELAGYAKAAGAAKSMFKEKTAAHKVLAATEKALHIARIAMDVKEMFFDTAKTGAAVTNSATRTGASVVEAGVDAVKAVIKAISDLPFPLNIAAGAATAAVVGGLLSQIGGSGPNVSGAGAAISSEQRQETQGTAMGWDSEGNKVQVRRGVFGDTDAKSESIANSLERIKEVSVEGLSYDNKVVKLLDSIDRGINNTAKSLYRVQGLRTGSMFGTQEGTSGGGLTSLSLGGKTSREITDSGILLKGSFAELGSIANKSALELFEDVKKTKKSWYGKTKTSYYTNFKEVGDDVSKFFSEIFTNATSMFIEVGKNAGIGVDTISNILSNLTVDQKVSLRGLKGAELEKEIESIIGSTLDEAAYAIFSSFDRFSEFGEGMLETVIRVTDTNEKVRQVLKNQMLPDIDELLRASGVSVVATIQEATYGLSQEINTALDKKRGLFGSLFSVIFKPKEVRDALAEVKNILGEEAANALKGNLRNLTQPQLAALKAGGAKFVDTLTEAVTGEFVSLDPAAIKQRSYEITEALVGLAGGLEEFADKANFYMENFLTEEERLIPVAASVSDELGRLATLGYGSADGLVDTREEFKNLVMGLDLTTQSGQEVYTALMNLAPGFDKLMDYLDEISGKAVSLQTRIIELIGTDAEILANSRALVLEQTPETLRSTQSYIFALEDVKTAQDKLNEARKREQDSIKTTVNNLRNYIDSLKQFRESLLLGSTSTLTPGERYTEAKRQLDALVATATSRVVTVEEIAARDKALSQLQGASSAFLDASRTYNASSSQYTTDFGYVQDILESTSSTLAAQLTDSEKQLEALVTINESVLSVASAIQALADAQDRANALAPKAGQELHATLGNKASDIVRPTRPTRATIVDGTVYGAQGSSMSVEQAKSEVYAFLRETVDGVAAGTISAAQEQKRAQDLHETFVSKWKFTSAQVADILDVTPAQVLEYFAEYGLPAFASGTNYVPENMVAQIHKGERIVPAADNEQLMQSINSRSDTNRALVQEIKALRQEVQQLRKEQQKQTGDIIISNYDANIKASNGIADAVASSAQDVAWFERSKPTLK